MEERIVERVLILMILTWNRTSDNDDLWDYRIYGSGIYYPILYLPLAFLPIVFVTLYIYTHIYYDYIYIRYSNLLCVW